MLHPPPLRLRRRHWIVLLGVLVVLGLAWRPAMSLLMGDYACSAVDQVLHLTPCRQMWQLPDGEQARHIVFSPNSRQLAVTTGSALTLWDVTHGTPMPLPPVTLGVPLQWSAFSPDGALLAVTGADGVQVIDLAMHQVRSTILDGGSDAGGVVFSPDGRWLAHSVFRRDAARNLRGQVLIYDAQTGQLAQTVADSPDLPGLQLWFTPDSQHVVFTLVDARARAAVVIWDMRTRQRSAAIVGRPDTVSPDARMLVLSADGTTLERRILAPTHDAYPSSSVVPRRCMTGKAVAVLPGQDRVITTNTPYDAELMLPPYPGMCVVRLDDGNVVWHAAVVGCCPAVAPDGSVLAIGALGGIQIWRIPPEWYQ